MNVFCIDEYRWLYTGEYGERECRLAEDYINEKHLQEDDSEPEPIFDFSLAPQGFGELGSGI